VDISKIYNVTAWIRTCLLALMLWLTLSFGLLSNIVPESPINTISSLNAFLASCFAAWSFPTLTFSFCGKIWNKITPIKNKPTIIESEIVYILSVLTSIPIFTAIFFNLGLVDITRLLPILAVASLPSALAAYAFQLAFKNTIQAAMSQYEIDGNEENNLEFEETDIASSLTPISYITASLTLVILSMTFSILYLHLKGSLQPSILMSASSAYGALLFLIGLFGGPLLTFGTSIKNKLGITAKSPQANIIISWVFGIMIWPMGSLAISIAPYLTQQFNTETIATVGPHLIALSMIYASFAVSTTISGWALSRFYKAKPISAVFA